MKKQLPRLDYTPAPKDLWQRAPFWAPVVVAIERSLGYSTPKRLGGPGQASGMPAIRARMAQVERKAVGG